MTRLNNYDLEGVYIIMSVTKQWLTLQEASEITGKSTAALRMWIKRRTAKGETIRAKKDESISGKYWIIHRDELDELVEQVHPEAGVEKTRRTSHESVNLVTLEYYDEQKGKWNKEKEELRSGILMYRFKFEELDRKLKLLPAPVEVITYRVEEQEAALEEKKKALQEKEKVLSDTQTQLRKTEEVLKEVSSDRGNLKDTLQDTQNVLRGTEKEKEGILSRLEVEKASRNELEEHKQKAEKEAEATKEELAKLREEKEKLAARLKEEGDSRLQTQAELEKEKEIKASLETVIKLERERPWWKKLFGMS